MRRRLPSPALVIASIALFAALGGAGFAASLALAPVRSPKPLVFLPASVSANGKVTGARVTGRRLSAGVYTLTITGNTFGANAKVAGVQSVVTPQVITIAGSNRVIDPTCDTAGKSVASNGPTTLKVECFTFDPASGWQPTDAAFDVQIAGPSH
jgi:hypothetical protein